MATQTVNPTEASKKPKFSLSVQWENAKGEWKEATSERTFDLPDEIGEITVAVVSDDGSTTENVDRKFRRIIFKNEKDVVSALQSNPQFVISALNYGSDLFARGTIKGPIAAEVEGPGKTLKKMAEQYLASRRKLGKSEISFERALEIVTAMNDAE